jgi:ABC-type Mn2+/Zn2+ transport system permease subunit
VDTLVEIVSPGFLLRDALIGSVLVGLVCPLVGVYFVLRRMIFLGVALPQVSAAGIAFAALAHQVVTSLDAHLGLGERWLAMLGSLMFTLTGLVVLAAFERQRETVEARIGITYALAAAATMLFLALNPSAEAHMVLMAFRKEFLLVSFDREMAMVFGKHVGLWDILLYLTIGITISLGVMTAGPIVTFGFLVVPPFTARLISRRMLTFSLISAGLGGVTAFAGFYCAYRFDLPLGPAEVALASLVLGAVWTANQLYYALSRWWAT